MRPSTNAFALVRVFDTMTPDADSKEMFREQSQSFIELTASIVEPITALFDTYANPERQGNRFNALVSLVSDCGIEVFMSSRLPLLVSGKATSKNLLREAFAEIPEFNSQIRPDIAEQLRRYRMPLFSRRHYEYELYNGNMFFTIGKTLNASKQIVYAPSVLHPIFRWMLGKG